MDSEKEKVFTLMQKFNTAMLVTRTHSDGLHGRPMEVAEVTPEGRINFVASLTSPKVSEITEDASVLVIFQDDTEWLCIYGICSVTREEKTLERLWKERWRVWYPSGPQTESLGLLSVEPLRAEYWDNSGFSALEYNFKIAAAYVTGTTPELGSNIHGKVDLASP